ncbi:MAG: sensor histidine kinase [Mariprofundaceae bacterium]
MQLLEHIGNLPIRYRIMASLLAVVLLGEAITGYLMFREYKSSMINQSIQHIGNIRNNSIHDIRTKIQSLIIQTDQFSRLPDVIEYLNHQHKGTNSSDEVYTQGIAGPMLFIKEKSHLHDLLIIAKNGDILHTIANENDAGTNLLTGSYKDSQLASAFRKSQKMLQTHISDVAYYEPSAAQALFIVTPIIYDNQLLGAIAGQVNLDSLVEIFKSHTGLGTTGEIVTGILRGDSAYLEPLKNMSSTSFNLKIPMGASKAKPMQKALQGNVGCAFDVDYRQIDVLAAWGYIPELQMGIAVKIDAEELLAPVRHIQNITLLIVTGIMIFTGIIGYVLSVGITTPIHSLTETAMKYASDNHAIRSDITSRDEIGLLARAFNSMADNIDRFAAAIQEKNKQLLEAASSLEQKVKERTATLAAANEEIKSFAYIVSHDLRSPLVNMKGFSGELEFTLRDVSKKIAQIEGELKSADREELKRLIEEDVPESMRFISTSVDKMDAMLTAILNLSRMGRRELQFEKIDLKELCKSVLAPLAFQIKETKTVVTLEELPEIVNDRMVVEQIMGNLIGNAIKYLSPERPGQIRVYSEIGSKGITISVEDNGYGISDDEKEKVFQIFRRGQHQDVVGEGMGLAYVQTLARAQNGSISYTSRVNAGSTFSVYLPNKNSEEI